MIANVVWKGKLPTQLGAGREVSTEHTVIYTKSLRIRTQVLTHAVLPYNLLEAGIGTEPYKTGHGSHVQQAKTQLCRGLPWRSTLHRQIITYNKASFLPWKVLLKSWCRWDCVAQEQGTVMLFEVLIWRAQSALPMWVKPLFLDCCAEQDFMLIDRIKDTM